MFPGSFCVRLKLARYRWLIIIDQSSVHGMNNTKMWCRWHLLLMIWSTENFPLSDDQFDAEETQISFHNFSQAGRQFLHFRPEETWPYVGLWVLAQHADFSQLPQPKPDGLLTSGCRPTKTSFETSEPASCTHLFKQKMKISVFFFEDYHAVQTGVHVTCVWIRLAVSIQVVLVDYSECGDSQLFRRICDYTVSYPGRWKPILEQDLNGRCEKIVDLSGRLYRTVCGQVFLETFVMNFIHFDSVTALNSFYTSKVKYL